MDPCKWSFDDPSSCDHNKTFYIISTFDAFDYRAIDFRQCFFQLLDRVTVIGKNMTDAGEACVCEIDNARRTIFVLNIYFLHDACAYVILYIGCDVPFAPPDLLPAVEAARSTRFCCPDALTINDSCHQFFITTTRPAREASECFVEKIKDPAITGSGEIIPGGHEEWKRLGSKAC